MPTSIISDSIGKNLGPEVAKVLSQMVVDLTNAIVAGSWKNAPCLTFKQFTKATPLEQFYDFCVIHFTNRSECGFVKVRWTNFQEVMHPIHYNSMLEYEGTQFYMVNCVQSAGEPPVTKCAEVSDHGNMSKWWTERRSLWKVWKLCLTEAVLDRWQRTIITLHFYWWMSLWLN